MGRFIGKIYRVLGVPLCQLGGSAGEVSPEAHGGLPNSVYKKWLVQSTSLSLMSSESPGCCSPSLSPPPVMQHISIFLVGQEEIFGFFGSILHSWEADCSLCALTFLSRRYHGSFFLVLSWRKDKAGKGKWFHLTSSMHTTILDFFFLI